jgi:hypothetical protein
VGGKVLIVKTRTYFSLQKITIMKRYRTLALRAELKKYQARIRREPDPRQGELFNDADHQPLVASGEGYNGSGQAISQLRGASV